MLHHGARRQDRVLRPENAGDRAGPAVAPVHHRGVHFLRAGGGEHRAAAGIEQRVVFQRDDRFRDRVERAAAGGEDRAAGLQSAAQPGVVFGLPLGAHRGRGGSCRRRHARQAQGLIHRRNALSAFVAMSCRHTCLVPINARTSEWARGGMILERQHPVDRSPRSPSLLRLVPLGLGISVVPLDTAVNIAFPDITGSFGLPIPMIQWVVICYVLTHAGLMLAFGRVGDMWGHAPRVPRRAGLEHRGVSAVRRGAELRLAAVLPVFCRGSAPG